MGLHIPWKNFCALIRLINDTLVRLITNANLVLTVRAVLMVMESVRITIKNQCLDY